LRHPSSFQNLDTFPYKPGYPPGSEVHVQGNFQHMGPKIAYEIFKTSSEPTATERSLGPNHQSASQAPGLCLGPPGTGGPTVTRTRWRLQCLAAGEGKGPGPLFWDGKPPKPQIKTAAVQTSWSTFTSMGERFVSRLWENNSLCCGYLAK